MTKGDLEGWQLWGRPVKPVGLGLAVLMATLTVVNILNVGAFKALPLGDVIAVLAGVSLVTLVTGWALRSQLMAEVGLLSAAIVYTLRASFLLFTDGPSNEAIYLSVGAAIIAGGAFLLEHWDVRRRRGGGATWTPQ